MSNNRHVRDKSNPRTAGHALARWDAGSIPVSDSVNTRQKRHLTPGSVQLATGAAGPLTRRLILSPNAFPVPSVWRQSKGLWRCPYALDSRSSAREGVWPKSRLRYFSFSKPLSKALPNRVFGALPESSSRHRYDVRVSGNSVCIGLCLRFSECQ